VSESDPYYDKGLARWWMLFDFRKALQDLAAPAEDQVKAYEAFVPTAFELRESFDDSYVHLEDWFDWWSLNREQRATLEAVNSELERAPRDTDSLAKSPVWAGLRILAEEALAKLDWTLLDEPPPTPTTPVHESGA
jgi:hypothetical protein